MRLRDLDYYKIIIRLYTHTNLEKIIDEKIHVARIYHTDDRCESQPYIIYKSVHAHYEKRSQISIYESNRFCYLKFAAHLCIYTHKCMHFAIQTECSYLIGCTASINTRVLMRIDSHEILLQNQTFAASIDQIVKLVVQAKNKRHWKA